MALVYDNHLLTTIYKLYLQINWVTNIIISTFPLLYFAQI